MRWIAISLAMSIWTGGCVSSPEAKDASQSVTKSLSDLHTANAQLSKAWIAQIDDTRDQIGRAIIAASVIRSIEDHEGIKEQQDGDLIKVSTRIERAQNRASRLVADVLRIKVKATDDPKTVLDAFNKGKADSLAALIPNLGTQEEKDAVQNEVTQLRNGKLSDAATNTRVYVILTLQKMKAVVSDNLLHGLDMNLSTLQQMHTTLAAFVQADVTVSGSEIGQLVNDHADFFFPKKK